MSVDLGKLLAESGAILHGHFLLTSGRHSDVYFEKFRVLEQPHVLSALCSEIARKFSRLAPPPPPSSAPPPQSNPPLSHESSTSPVHARENWAAGEEFKCIDLVAGPTTGGIIIAFEVARQMGVPALYVESEDGVKKLRRGAQVQSAARVLVVDDVLTTGRSVFEVLDVIRAAGGEPAGVGVLIDRSETPPNFGVPLFAAYKVAAKSFAADDVPDWLEAIPVTKPGTRSEAKVKP